MKPLFSKDILLLLAISAVLFLLNTWGYPLFDVDEPRYAETAREMLTSPGDWITPHFNWMVRFDKPALFYWLIAGAYRLLGVSAFSARLISVLAATGLMLMLYFLAKRALNRQAGLMTAIIFATMIEVFTLARWSVTDMTLACFMAGTWIGLYYVLVRGPRWYLMAGLFAGLGMMTKGPVALVLPGFTFLLALAIYHRSQWRLLISPWIVAGLGLFVAISLPWYTAITLANPGDFINQFFFLHNVERFSGTVSGHWGGWYYYLPVFLLGGFPWTLFLPGLIRDLIQQRKTLPEVVRYAHLWFWVVFLFFSVSGTKLLTYVLPGFAPFALLMGWHWSRQVVLSTDPLTPEIMLKPAWLNRGLWLGLGVTLFLLYITIAHPHQLIPANIRDLYTPLYTQIALFLLTAILALCLILSYRPEKRTLVFPAMGLGMILLLIYVNVTLLPEAANIAQGDTMTFARRAVKDEMKLGTYKLKKPSLVFYTRQKIYFIPDVKEPQVVPPMDTKLLHSQPQALYLVVKNKDLDSLHQVYPSKPVLKGHIYSLVQVEHPNLSQEINQ